MAFARAKKLPALYGSGNRSRLAILANLALGGGVLVLTAFSLFWSPTLNRFLTPERYKRIYSDSATSSPPGTKPSTKELAQQKRDNLVRDVNAEWMARKLFDTSVLTLGDKKDQLVIVSYAPLPRSKSDPLAKELIARKGKEFIAAGFANSFEFRDKRAAVSATYQFKLIDVLARETALTLGELWFISQKQVKPKATLDPADDTKLIITSPAFTNDNQNMLTTELPL